MGSIGRIGDIAMASELLDNPMGEIDLTAKFITESLPVLPAYSRLIGAIDDVEMGLKKDSCA